MRVWWSVGEGLIARVDGGGGMVAVMGDFWDGDFCDYSILAHSAYISVIVHLRYFRFICTGLFFLLNSSINSIQFTENFLSK